jgi:hypothetical protein
MGNPANALASIFESWQVNSGSVYTSRGTNNPTSNDFWRTQAHAVELVMQVDSALTALSSSGRPTDAYEPYINEWLRGVFQPERTWQTQTAGPVISEAALMALKSFGLLIDMAAGPSMLTDTQRGTIVGCINDGIALLATNPDGLTEREQLYVLRLLENARQVFEDRSVLSAVDLQATIDQLNGALLGAGIHLAAVGNTEAAQQLTSVASRIISAVRGFVYDAAAVAQIVGTVFTMGQITPGK